VKRIEVTKTVEADAKTCFDYVADPTNVHRYMTSVKLYEPLTRKSMGKGARFRTVITVGGRDVEAELEVTEWIENERSEAVSRKGPKTHGIWMFEAYDDGTTDVTLVHEYELPGVFKLLPSGPIHAGMTKELDRSLTRLKHLIEALKVGTSKKAKPKAKAQAKAKPKAAAKGPTKRPGNHA
jgi:uncharacterized membrane protein